MEITGRQRKKVYVVLSKRYTAERYSVMEKMDKEMDIEKCSFSEEIEQALERGEL